MQHLVEEDWLVNLIERLATYDVHAAYGALRRFGRGRAPVALTERYWTLLRALEERVSGG